MDKPQTVYRYHPEGQLRPVEDMPEKLLVADSFFVDNGLARAPELHRNRFIESSKILAGIPARELDRFWQLAMQAIPATGQWFPRVELLFSKKQPALQIRLRPAPARRNEARLILCGTPDKRARPRHKGPDITWLTARRNTAADMGADEGILCTPSQYLLEGLFSTIMWWEGETLCQTPLSRRILPSVTAKLVRQIAADRGIPVAFRFKRYHELNGCRTWVVNALHGIRSAADWPLAPWHSPVHTDRDEWQETLHSRFLRPIHAPFSN
ncbi:aminotransferase class IV [Oxalobacter sp. OttesenSCG-928-P03]|nr:aminotransferase class IV [Oxalobacter sp. OttesenSCG-928-P03]